MVSRERTIRVVRLVSFSTILHFAEMRQSVERQ